jgi:hypothetical protein
MVAAVDRTASRIYAGPCHALVEGAGEFTRGGRCQRDLYAKPGVDEIRCDGHRADGEGCGAVHTTDERRDWLINALSGALVGLDEMLSALPHLFPDLTRPPRGVVSSWINQGRLMAHGCNATGEPTFVGGDVLNLIKAYKPHKFAPRRKRVVA